jgi:hypothetical protein
MMKNLLMASACAASMLTALPGYADEAGDLVYEGKRTDRIAASASASAVADRIAADFPDRFGTPEQTRKLVTDLRDGTLKGKSRGTMGYGEIHILLALSQAYADSKSLPAGDAMNEVLAQRADGKGWGKIARDLGLNLGQVVSRVRSGNERLAGASERRGAERDAKPDRPVKPERPDKPERPERAGRG